MNYRYILYARKSSESEDRQTLSIKSQISELQDLAEKSSLNVINVYQESKSAKAPGRPVFNQMMQLLNKGQADGILCWKLDRLARNPIDGGALIWAMDRGKLKEIVTIGQTFKRSSMDTFFMQMEFGVAKKYIDDLSENVKRGIRRKIADGEPPGNIPIGYMRDPVTKKVVADPKRFKIVKKIWQEIASGQSRPVEVWEKAVYSWDLRTPKRLRSGDNPISLTSFYRLLQNPFYFGQFKVNGSLHEGKYPAMISIKEYDRVQTNLNRSLKHRPQKLEFKYTGLIRCGSCNRGVTSENKINRFGSKYIYYHCSRKRPWAERCREQYIQEKELETQVSSFLSKLEISPTVHVVLNKYLDTLGKEELNHQKKIKKNAKTRLSSLEKEKDSLLNLKIRNQVDDDEYEKKKREIQLEIVRIKEKLNEPDKVIEPLKKVFSFATVAKKRFDIGSHLRKRRILQKVSSNLLLKDKILLIEAEKPFTPIINREKYCGWQAVVDDVRNLLVVEDDFFISDDDL